MTRANLWTFFQKLKRRQLQPQVEGTKWIKKPEYIGIILKLMKSDKRQEPLLQHCYLITQRSIRKQTSSHWLFLTDESAFRMILRAWGHPLKKIL